MKKLRRIKQKGKEKKKESSSHRNKSLVLGGYHCSRSATYDCSFVCTVIFVVDVCAFVCVIRFSCFFKDRKKSAIVSHLYA